MVLCDLCGKDVPEDSIFRVSQPDGSESKLCIECFVHAGLTAGLILLQGEPGSGTSESCKSFAHMLLLMQRPVLFIPTEEPASVVHRALEGLCGRELGEDKLRFIDCYSWRTGEPSEDYLSVRPGNLTELSILINKTISTVNAPGLILDSVSPLVLEAGEEASRGFFQTVSARTRAAGGLGLCTLVSGVHSQGFERFMRHFFDGVLEMKVEDVEDRLERFMRIFYLRGVRRDSRWIPFELLADGISAKNLQNKA